MNEQWHRKEKWSTAQQEVQNYWRAMAVARGAKQERRLTDEEKRQAEIVRAREEMLENRRWQEEMGTNEVWD